MTVYSESKDPITLDVESITTTPGSSFSDPVLSKSRRHELSPGEQKRVLFKIDMRVCVVLGAINCINILDRANLGLAAVAGLNQDLQLNEGDRFTIVALIFFVPYLIFEIPSTFVAWKVGARLLLMSVCALWGVLMIGIGFVRTWEQIAGIRVLLGLFESVFYPVIIFLLSSWYTRYELQKRYAVSTMLAVVVKSLGAILAFGFLQMEGAGNLRGWRWTFVMEGIVTVLVGLSVGFLVVDFPDKARGSFKFLNDAQIDWVVQRLREDRDDVDAEEFTWKRFFSGGYNLPVWLYTVMICCCSTVGYTVSFFLPMILKDNMGYDRGKAICLAAPPYLFAAGPVYMSAWLGDKYRTRGPIVVFNSLVAIVGLTLLGWAKSSGVRYASTFLICSGVFSNVPTIMTYQANNICGHWNRAFSSTTLVIGLALSGIFGACIFRDHSAAGLRIGIGVTIGLKSLNVMVTLGLMAFYRRQNQLALQGCKLIFDRPGFLYSL